MNKYKPNIVEKRYNTVSILLENDYTAKIRKHTNTYFRNYQYLSSFYLPNIIPYFS